MKPKLPARMRGKDDINLYVAWISKKLEDFKPGVRKGTPKGEKIGWGEAKYKCSLLIPSALKIKTIARLCGVSYGVLRKWRSEEDFKRRAAQHGYEYFVHYNRIKQQKRNEYAENRKPRNGENHIQPRETQGQQEPVYQS